MLALLLAPALAVNCGLPDYIDPAPHICQVSKDGWANINVDAVNSTGAPNLTIAVIEEKYTDADRGNHYPHPGTLDDSQLISNSRYVLSCPDTSGNKTLKLTVSRNRTLTKFQGEWVKLFPKGSWKEVASEFEPYQHNNFGSVVPLSEFRPDVTPDSYADTSGTLTDELNVFMSLPEDGEFEVKYGSPYLKSDCLEGPCDPANDGSGKWIALEFKSTLIRVGNPWGSCGGSSDYSGVGTIVPLYLGNPNEFRSSYDAAANVIKTHQGIPVYVVLQLYTPTSGINGTYSTNAERWTPGRPSAKGEAYTQCFAAGTPCPGNYAVCAERHCNLAQWREIVADLRTHTNVKVLAYVETTDSYGDARSAQDMQADATASVAAIAGATSAGRIVDGVEKAVIDGFYFGGAAAAELAEGSSWTSGTAGMNNTLVASAALKSAKPDNPPITVIGTGSALMDPYVLEHAGAPNTIVTLSAAAERIGSWTPFAWYPGKAPSTWGALLTNVADTAVSTVATTLFDRGYGFVYIHSEPGFETVSTYLDTVLTTVKTQAGARRLEEVLDVLDEYQSHEAPLLAARRLEARELQAAPTTAWGCDETLFQCAPTCLKTTGLVTVQVTDSECAGEPLDPCQCSCLFDARWACESDRVVCEATDTFNLEGQVVGDLVCSSRGSPKPDFAEPCVAQPVARGSWPTGQCVGQYQAAKDARLAAKRAATSTTEAPSTEAPEDATTDAPTTEDPTTKAPTTEDPTTEAPTTAQTEAGEELTVTSSLKLTGLTAVQAQAIEPQIIEGIASSVGVPLEMVAITGYGGGRRLQASGTSAVTVSFELRGVTDSARETVATFADDAGPLLAAVKTAVAEDPEASAFLAAEGVDLDAVVATVSEPEVVSTEATEGPTVNPLGFDFMSFSPLPAVAALLFLA